MSVEDQDISKRLHIFKQSLKFQESAAGVVIQRVSGADLKRIMAPLLAARANATVRDPMDVCPDPKDPLVHAIYSMDTIFAGCLRKGVDMLSSVEAIASEYAVDGTKGNGCLILAWRTTFDSAARRLMDPELVGAMTLYKFKPTPNFSTDARSLSDHDHAILKPLFGVNAIYIDCMCAKGGGGVGKLLALHACRYAITKKAKAIVALSYSQKKLKPGTKPESYKIFHDLGFEHLIETANYTTTIYGTWFVTTLEDLSFKGILTRGIELCTRRGLSPKTRDRLVWRCPA